MHRNLATFKDFIDFFIFPDLLNFFHKIKRNSGLKNQINYNNGKLLHQKKKAAPHIIHPEMVGVDLLWLCNKSVLINDVHLIG